ncbi:hypothetical protein RvY_03110 [Ramazzottius varieornatus]|uniref:Uncharacterized protein n=1 Tax=Ramazzottius varieornatus TaxID=947166 RepID=A0A1D1USN9_RAMVA|nr:hypothetical protein RvY_03110 [Ramazzottius varieornatus]
MNSLTDASYRDVASRSFTPALTHFRLGMARLVVYLNGRELHAVRLLNGVTVRDIASRFVTSGTTS